MNEAQFIISFCSICVFIFDKLAKNQLCGYETSCHNQILELIRHRSERGHNFPLVARTLLNFRVFGRNVITFGQTPDRYAITSPVNSDTKIKKKRIIKLHYN